MAVTGVASTMAYAQWDSGNSLSQLLTKDDRAGLAMAMKAVERDSGIENIRSFTQKNLYTRGILVWQMAKKHPVRYARTCRYQLRTQSDVCRTLRKNMAGSEFRLSLCKSKAL